MYTASEFRPGIEVVAPHQIQDLITGEYLTRVVQEQLEQVKLDLGERDRSLASNAPRA